MTPASAVSAASARAAIESWLTLNDPIHAETVHRFHASRSLALPQVSGGVVSKALLAGTDRDRVLSDSAKLKEKLNTPEGASYFASNPADGCSSIMNMARVAAGYNPALMGPAEKRDEFFKQNLAAYDDYMRRLLAAPFFDLVLNDSKNLSKRSTDYNDLIDQTVDLFEGILEEDKSSIKKSLVALAKTAASHQGSVQNDDVFSQSVMAVASSGQITSYQVNIYSSHISMVADTAKGATTTQNDVQIRRTKLSFRHLEWPSHAAKVWAKQVTTVDDWLSLNDTPTGATKTKLCIE